MLSILLFVLSYLAYALGGMYYFTRGLRPLAFFFFGVFCFNNLASANYLIPQLDSAFIRTGATLACGLFLILCGATTRQFWRIDRANSAINLYALSIIALGCVLALQSLRSSETEYAFRKTVQFAVFSIVPVVAVTLAGRISKLEIQALFSGITLSTLMIVIVMTLNPQTFAGFDGRLSVGPEIHPINVARNIGLGICLLLTFYLTERGSWAARYAGVLAAVASAPAFLLTGSRGPAVAALAAVVVVVVSVRKIQPLLRLSISGVLLAAVIATIYSGALDDVLRTSSIGDLSQPLDRIKNLSERIGDNRSDVSRFDRFQVAIDGFIDSKLMGIGTGEFPAIWTGPKPGGIFSDKDYPHNFILETACELGIFGLIFLAWAMLLALRASGTWLLDPQTGRYQCMIVSLLAYCFVNASISGDLGTNYLVFLSGAVAVSTLSRPKMETNASEEDDFESSDLDE